MGRQIINTYVTIYQIMIGAMEKKLNSEWDRKCCKRTFEKTFAGSEGGGMPGEDLRPRIPWQREQLGPRS